MHRFNLCQTCGILRDTQKRLLLQLQRFTIIIDATATSFRIYRNRPRGQRRHIQGHLRSSESFIKSHQVVLDDTNTTKQSVYLKRRSEMKEREREKMMMLCKTICKNEKKKLCKRWRDVIDEAGQVRRKKIERSLDPQKKRREVSTGSADKMQNVGRIREVSSCDEIPPCRSSPP